MKTICPPSYHHKGFMATHALGHMIYIYILHYIYTLYIIYIIMYNVYINKCI